MINILDPVQVSSWIKSGEAVLIDVREPDEFKSEHIPCAVSLPLAKLHEVFPELHLPEGRKIIFQCHAGTRSGKACMAMAGLDSSGAYYSLDGGISAWKKAGLPVVTSGDSANTSPTMSIFRQVQVIIGGLVALCVALGLAGLTTGFVIAGLLGGALFMAGLTGWCGLAVLLSKMPWNK